MEIAPQRLDGRRLKMAKLRLIPRLDIKGPNLIKGVHLEGLRIVGDPHDYATRYYEQGADELIYMDTVASLYGRNNLQDIVKRTAQNVFIPLTVGGGIRSVDDVRQLLRAGADKVAINTAAVQRPRLLSEIAQAFGSQCIVLSIEAKQVADGKWEALTDNGRERTGKDVMQWLEEACSHGIGEIMVTSVDREGTRKGFDIPLMQAVVAATSVPVIASGGMGSPAHLAELYKRAPVDAVAIADVLHYDRTRLSGLRESASDNGIPVRRLP